MVLPAGVPAASTMGATLSLPFGGPVRGTLVLRRGCTCLTSGSPTDRIGSSGKTPRWFTKEEAARLLAAMPTEGDRLMVDLDLHIGLRWEELVALRGLRVDQLRKVIVVQDVMDLSGLREYPKADASLREMPIPPHLVEPILRRAKADLAGFLWASTPPRPQPPAASHPAPTLTHPPRPTGRRQAAGQGYAAERAAARRPGAPAG
jgi:integrase